MSSHPASPSSLRRDFPSPAVAVFGGGVLGSAARLGIGELIPPSVGEFPLAVLTVNLVGSFLLGLLISRRELSTGSRRWSVQFWGIGVLGSFTTFSAFSLDLFSLLDAGQFGSALAYLALSLVGGLAAALGGLRLGGDGA